MRTKFDELSIRMVKAMKRRRKILLALLGVASIFVSVLGLFVLNGLVFCDGNVPRSGILLGAEAAPEPCDGQFRIMAFNIAKCFVYKGGIRFSDRQEVVTRLEEICDIIRNANPDVLCLSEVVHECGPCNLDQVHFISQRTGLAYWAFGENFSFGLPFYRIVSGNAILSRYPLHSIANIDLAGRKPFLITKNNRRALLAEVEVPEVKALKVWSIHNDSFNLSNNFNQVKQELAYDESDRVVMAGDFNTTPDSDSMRLIQQSDRFSGIFNGPKTFPSHSPNKTIDYVFGLGSWQCLDHQVIMNNASDHCAVLTAFAIGNSKKTTHKASEI